jgi:hypothetical protein
MLRCYTHVKSGNIDLFFSVDRLGKQPCRGYGMTLRMPNTPKSDAWYPMLENDPNFTISFGVDGTGTASTLFFYVLQALDHSATCLTVVGHPGSVYDLKNLDGLCEEIKQNGDTQRVNLVVADGGFEIKKNEKGEHMENYQELFSSRIILSEILVMLKTLQPGGTHHTPARRTRVCVVTHSTSLSGHFVCKAFDCFSSISTSFIYLLTLLFEDVYIIKPLRSRIVNSERYFVGKFMKRYRDRQ